MNIYNKISLKKYITYIMILTIIGGAVLINPICLIDARAENSYIDDRLNVFQAGDDGKCITNIQDGDIWPANGSALFDFTAEEILEIFGEEGRLMDLIVSCDRDKEVPLSDDLETEIVFFGTVDEDVRNYSNITFSTEAINRAYVESKLFDFGDDIRLNVKNKRFFDTGEGYCWYKLVEKKIGNTYIKEDGSEEKLLYTYYKVEEISRGEDSTFFIDDFNREDKGLYMCTSIKDGETNKLAAIYNICEKSKLDVRPFNEVTYVKDGGKAVLGVSIYDTMYDYDDTTNLTYENNENIKYRWYKDGASINWTNRKLIIDEVKKSDYGIYTVVVQENGFLKTIEFALEEMTKEILTNEVKNSARKWTTYVNVLGTEGEFEGKIINNTYELKSSIDDYKIWAYVADNSNTNCQLEIPNYADDSVNSTWINCANIADAGDGLYGGNKVIKCFGVPNHIIKNDENYQLYSTKIINGTTAEKIEYAKKLREYEFDYLIKQATSEETFVFQKLGINRESRVVKIQGNSEYICEESCLEGTKEYKWKKDGKYINNNNIFYKNEFGNIMSCGPVERQEYGCPYGDKCPESYCYHNELLRTIVFNVIYREDLTANPINEIKIGIGQSVKFYVNARSSLPITYEWYDSIGNKISNEKVLELNNITEGMINNIYKCVISDEYSKQEYLFRMINMNYKEVSSEFYKITRKSNSIELRWKPAKDAVGYRLYVWDPVNKKYNVVHKNLKTNFYNFTELQSGKEYKFAVKAYTIHDGNVYWSTKFASIYERTLPSRTSKISVAKRSTKYVKLSWEPVTGATGYRVYIAKNGKYEIVAKANKSTSFTKMALKSKTKYKFAVKAYIIYKGQVLWSDTFTTINVTTK